MENNNCVTMPALQQFTLNCSQGKIAVLVIGGNPRAIMVDSQVLRGNPNTWDEVGVLCLALGGICSADVS